MKHKSKVLVMTLDTKYMVKKVPPSPLALLIAMVKNFSAGADMLY
jgi:hypothetical protein